MEPCSCRIQPDPHIPARDEVWIAQITGFVIVQVGLQQRSWHHFQEAAKLFQDGYVGSSVNHCQMCPPGGGGRVTRDQPPPVPQAPPEGFNWEMFQGPAKRKPFVPERRRWRG